MFFFSSRRRHTRSKRDWSSDVCSSDLVFGKLRTSERGRIHRLVRDRTRRQNHGVRTSVGPDQRSHGLARESAQRRRSEERRVGKAARSGRGEVRYKNKAQGNRETG